MNRFVETISTTCIALCTKYISQQQCHDARRHLAVFALNQHYSGRLPNRVMISPGNLSFMFAIVDYILCTIWIGLVLCETLHCFWPLVSEFCFDHTVVSIPRKRILYFSIFWPKSKISYKPMLSIMLTIPTQINCPKSMITMQFV